MWWMPSSFIATLPCIAAVQDGALIPRFGRARRDPALAVLEGLHPLKHALRFGADVLEVLTRDAGELARLAAQLAPDVSARMLRGRARDRPRGVRPARAARAVDRRDRARAAPRRRARSRARAPATRARGRCSRTRATSATWARACASPPPPTSPACSPPAATTRGTPTRCAAPPGCTSPCPSRGWTRRWISCSSSRTSTGARCSRSTPTASRSSPPSCPRAPCSRSAPSATASAPS